AARHGVVRSDLERVRELTPLPIWVKGVLHPDDAVAIREGGFAGIIVSNHGGRSLDGVIATLRVLPEVRAAVGDDFPVLVDGGIRSGMDVFKALASGADAVLVGRLQAYALAVAGALGVAHLLRTLTEELQLAMAMTGCEDLAAVRSALLR
ncbi:alpha-hydroxy-acid oxidizing protein, partial [bacterium]